MHRRKTGEGRLKTLEIHGHINSWKRGNSCLPLGGGPLGEVSLLIFISYIFHKMAFKNWKHSFNKYSRITQHWARLEIQMKVPAHGRKLTRRE